MKTRLWLLAWLAGIVLLAGGARPVHAESVAVKVFLYYMPNVSNYGPTAATGVAMFNAGDGDLSLEVDGLPLVAGLAYEVWVSVSSEPVAMTSFGKFNPDSTGRAKYHQTLDDLARADYRFIIITIEADPDPSPAPTSRRSIAGVIPDVAALAATPTPTRPAVPGQGSAGAATATPAHGSAPAQGVTPPAPAAPPTVPPPSRLPTTGGQTPDSTPSTIFVMLAALGVIAIAGCAWFAQGRHA